VIANRLRLPGNAVVRLGRLRPETLRVSTPLFVALAVPDRPQERCQYAEGIIRIG